MVSIIASNMARNIHNESKREHGAAELEKLKVEQIFNNDGRKVANRLLIIVIHHKRNNRDKALANGEARINGLDSCRGYGKRRLSAYNGGFIRNDRLCIRESPLRFSHRDDETCLDYLQDTPPNWSDQLHDPFMNSNRLSASGFTLCVEQFS